MRRVRLCQIFLILAILLLPSLTMASAVEVSADSKSFDPGTGWYTLEGNVVVRVRDTEIQAQKAEFSWWTLEVNAYGGITVVQGATTFSGDSVYVNIGQHHAVVEGNIHLEDNGITFAGSKADFNWRTKDVSLSNVTITDASGERYANEALYNLRSKSLSY